VWERGGDSRGKMGRGYGNVRERGCEGYGRCVREFFFFFLNNFYFFSLYIYIYIIFIYYFFYKYN
jgi:hypothetical protein